MTGGPGDRGLSQSSSTCVMVEKVEIYHHGYEAGPQLRDACESG